MMKRAFALTAAAAVLAGLAAGPARADLMLVAPVDFDGTGLGSVNTILTITSPRNTTFEQGSVGRLPGNPNDVLMGDTLTGASQTLTRTIGSLGITSASNIRVIFNAVEPAGNDITLASLVLSIYDPAGNRLFSSGSVTCPSLGGACNFPNTFTGAGNSGFVFALTPEQAAQAQTFAFGAGFANNRIGLSASAGNANGGFGSATGGFETFFVANAGGRVVTPVPEPETYALMMAGLGALGFVARRRKLRK